MFGEACLPSNAYCPRTSDYTLYSGVHVCWSEHSDSLFVYGFTSLDYGLSIMTAATYNNTSRRFDVFTVKALSFIWPSMHIYSTVMNRCISV